MDTEEPEDSKQNGKINSTEKEKSSKHLILKEIEDSSNYGIGIRTETCLFGLIFMWH
jgi:hypothetical protein